VMRRAKDSQDLLERLEGENVLLVAVPSRFVDIVEMSPTLNGLGQVFQNVGRHLDAVCNEVFG
jgi:hypothetical protein